MSLINQINQDFINAYKSKDKTSITTLRMLKNSLNLAEKNKKSPLSDEDILRIIQKEIKQREDSINEYTRGKRQDLVELENAEIEVLNHYLPKQLSDQELESIIKDAISKFDNPKKSDMGKIISQIMPQVVGKADGSKVAKIVSTLLN